MIEKDIVSRQRTALFYCVKAIRKEVDGTGGRHVLFQPLQRQSPFPAYLERMMKGQRKKVLIDRQFQYGIAIKSALFPLLSMLIISAVLFFLAFSNNRNIDTINRNQAEIIDTFLSVPQLLSPQNPVTENANLRFRENLGKSYRIMQNNRIMIAFIITMTVVQTVILFIFAVRLTHKISGPIYVMTQHLRMIKNGETPYWRPLRNNDQFKDFYREMREAFEYINGAERDNPNGDQP